MAQSRLGGEVFIKIGRKIKAASPFAHTVIITHCNGGSGYLQTVANYADGGYEVQSNRFAPRFDERVTEYELMILLIMIALEL